MKKFKFKNNYTQGFTIIEVVLVLAIAGLIFLMVFVALPALQRNQRDAQRRSDLTRVATAINSYKANNRGKVLRVGDDLREVIANRYIKINGDTFQDPDGSEYNLTLSASDPPPTIMRKNPLGETWIFVFRGATCNNDGQGITFQSPIGNSTKQAVAMELEGGGIYCIDS